MTTSPLPHDDDYAAQRERMIDVIRRHGVRDERVLEAMRAVPRHRFIPAEHLGRRDPYGDYPCPIGDGQTISQPFIVAYMTEQLQVGPGDRVLEVGTGCGYQAAVLAALGCDVYGVERVPELFRQARENVGDRVELRCGDGYKGWPEHAPYQGILAACAGTEVPPPLLEQLADGGRLIMPVQRGPGQYLTIVSRDGDRFDRQEDMPVRFVPLVHERGEG